jgi:hypothetical protein
MCQLPAEITDSYSIISIILYDDDDDDDDDDKTKCTVSVLQFSFPALLQAIYRSASSNI